MNYVDDAATDPERTCMPAGQGIGGIGDIVPAGDDRRGACCARRATSPARSGRLA